MHQPDTIILGIESSCDDTAAAVIRNGKILSNIVAGQKVHEVYGGVVPELASRAHQQSIVPVVDLALKTAGIDKNNISAIAFTRGPGLLGSLLVGISFSKGLAMALDKPLIEVNHMEGHILAHFIGEIEEFKETPEFPFLCLTVSGGHTQIVLVKSHFDFVLLGTTLDDAAGEAFDKVAKVMGLPYPGGPLVDKLAREGNSKAFQFPFPQIAGLDFSFSGLKTAFMNFIRKNQDSDPGFIEKNKADICASIQDTIVKVLLAKLKRAAEEQGIKQISLAGGVSANSELRKQLLEYGNHHGWKVFIPKFEYCTDNAAMIAIAGYFKFKKGEFAPQSITPMARYEF